MPLSQYFDFGWQQKCVSEPRRVRHFTANLSVGTRLLSARLVMSRAAGTPGICVAKARSPADNLPQNQQKQRERRLGERPLRIIPPATCGLRRRSSRGGPFLGRSWRTDQLALLLRGKGGFVGMIITVIADRMPHCIPQSCSGWCKFREVTTFVSPIRRGWRRRS